MSHQSWFQNLLADQTPERRAQLEELTELKAERSLTSAEALLDYRIRSGSEELMASISEELGRTVTAPPELVIGIADDLAFQLSYMMNSCVVRNGDSENLGFLVEHIVDCSLLDCTKEKDARRIPLDELYRYWTVDERPFILHLATHAPECLDRDQVTHELLLRAFLYFRVTDESPILSSPDMESAMSLEEFLSNAELWTPVTDDLELSMEGALNLDGYETQAERDRAKRKFLRERTQALVERKDWLWRQHESIIPHDVAEIAYSSIKLYERAVRDLTLGHLWVQRKIAIALIYECADYADITNGEVKKIVNEAEARMLGNVIYYNDLMSELQSRKHTSQESLDSQIHLVARTNYFRLALLENRRYLEKFFSS